MLKPPAIDECHAHQWVRDMLWQLFSRGSDAFRRRVLRCVYRDDRDSWLKGHGLSEAEFINRMAAVLAAQLESHERAGLAECRRYEALGMELVYIGGHDFRGRAKTGLVPPEMRKGYRRVRRQAS
jgi:hypothetical protein